MKQEKKIQPNDFLIFIIENITTKYILKEYIIDDHNITWFYLYQPENINKKILIYKPDNDNNWYI